MRPREVAVQGLARVRLEVLDVVSAQHASPIGLEPLDLLRQLSRKEEVVSVQNGNVLACAREQGPIRVLQHADPGADDADHLVGVSLRIVGDDVARAVVRPVVRDDDLDGPIVLLEGALDRGSDEVAVVVRDDVDRDERAHAES